MAAVAKEQVLEVIKTVYDPEIPVNIYDLGLVYDVDVEDQEVSIVMTLTSPACPAAQSIPQEVEQKVVGTLGVDRCLVHIVWNPPWGPHRISPEGRKRLGMEEPEGDAPLAPGDAPATS